LLEEVQTLFAVAQDGKTKRLAGVVVYTRTKDGILEVVHIVVKEEYTVRGRNAKDEVASMLIDEVCRIAHQIQGIHSVRLAYGRGRIIVKSIQRPSSGARVDIQFSQ